jgi:hypothetical protein
MMKFVAAVYGRTPDCTTFDPNHVRGISNQANL